jgi:hypothetical protein
MPNSPPVGRSRWCLLQLQSEVDVFVEVALEPPEPFLGLVSVMPERVEHGYWMEIQRWSYAYFLPLPGASPLRV